MDSNIIKTFKDAVNNNGYLVETLSKENDKLRTTVKAFGGNQKNTDRLVEQNNILIQKMTEQHAKDVKDEKQRRFLVEQERDQLRKELEMWKERGQKSRLHSEKLVDQNTQLLQQNNQLQTEMQKLQDEQKTKNMEKAGRQQEQRRSTPQQKPKEEQQQQQRVDTNNTQLVTKGGQMQKSQDGKISGKFLFVSHWIILPSFLSSDNVKSIDYEKNNFDSLVPNISSYKKELLVWTYWKEMNTTSGKAHCYAILLSLCRQRKRLRPDGEIHCLYWYDKKESPSEPDKELVSLLTTCNKYLYTDAASKFSAFRQYWPKFVDSILSEETKKKYAKH